MRWRALPVPLPPFFVSSTRISAQGEQQLIEKSKAILSRLESVRSYIASQGGLDSSIEKAVKDLPDGNLSKDAKLTILKQVPIFADMKVGAEGAQEEGYSFRIFSDAPRNPDNKATLKELEILKRFEANPKLQKLPKRMTTKLRVSPRSPEYKSRVLYLPGRSGNIIMEER